MLETVTRKNAAVELIKKFQKIVKLGHWELHKTRFTDTSKNRFINKQVLLSHNFAHTCAQRWGVLIQYREFFIVARKSTPHCSLWLLTTALFNAVVIKRRRGVVMIIISAKLIKTCNNRLWNLFAVNLLEKKKKNTYSHCAPDKLPPPPY